MDSQELRGRLGRSAVEWPFTFAAIVIVALCLLAAAIESVPFRPGSDEGTADSDEGPDPEASSTVPTDNQVEPVNDFDSLDQAAVELADASIPESPSTNGTPAALKAPLVSNRSSEPQQPDTANVRGTTASDQPNSQPKRTSRSRQPARQPGRPSPNRVTSTSTRGGTSDRVQQRVGTLTIRAAPESVVEVNGTEVGSTNSSGFLVLSEIQPGRHVVVARKEGHAEATSMVEVQEGRAEVVELVSTVLPGRLTVTANVPDVLVRIGDEGEHRLPLNGLDVPAGSYRVTASRNGFNPVAKSLEIRPDEISTLEFVLEPVPVDELLQTAAGLLASGDYRAAAEAAGSVVGMRPEAGAAHRLLGTALYEQGRFNESIAPLRRAIDLGEDVELPTKHRHGGGGLRAGFCRGTMTLGRSTITFRSADQSDHGFSVGPDGLGGVAVAESYRRNAIRVNTSVQAGDQGRRRRNVDFVHRDTQRTREEENSLFFVLTCRNCDASLNVQFELMKHVSQ